MSDFVVRFKTVNDAFDKWWMLLSKVPYMGKHELSFKSFTAGFESRQAEIDRLTAELAECKKDAQRLDYLDDLNKKFNERMGTVYGWKLDWTCNRWALSDMNIPALSVRAAIDEVRGLSA